MMARGKKYSDEDIERGLEALAEAGGNAAKASRECGIPARTLREWKGQQFADEFAELRREKRSGLIDKVWAVAERAWDLTLEKLKPDEAGNAPQIKPRELATIAAIATDKGLLLGGEPTDITEQRESPIVYLPRIDGEDVEAEQGAAEAVS